VDGELTQNVAPYLTDLMEVFIDLLEVLLVAVCAPVFILYHKYKYRKRLPNAVAPREILSVRD
jgi:hypothetical protein